MNSKKIFFVTIISVGISIFLIGCRGKSVNTINKIGYNYTAQDSRYAFLLGTWTTNTAPCDAQLSLTIGDKDGKYAYTLKMNETEQNGFLEIKNEDGIYVFLPKIKWAEYRGTIPEDKEVDEVSLQDAFGLDFQYDDETATLMFQNIGNNMNYYVKLAELDCKYVVLKKNEVVGSNINNLVGTKWSWSGSVTTMILTFVNDKKYRIETPISESVEGTYKIETLDSGKKVITTDRGQYEIVGETLVETTEDGTLVFEKYVE